MSLSQAQRMIFRLLGLTFSLTLVAIASPVQGEEVLVAVATNFQNPVRDISAAFEKATGHRVMMSAGSSGKLYAQVIHGAPFEVFLSADSVRPKLLEEAGLTVPGSRFTYAVGRLALWSKDKGMVKKDGYRVLTEAPFSYLAIANPKTAPYGHAAVQVMRRLKVWDLVSSRLVQGENIGQALQFVASGNAELGFVALSQVLDPRLKGVGSFWKVPLTLHDALKQDAVLLVAGQSNPAALAFMRFMESPHARAVIQQFGYGTD